MGGKIRRLLSPYHDHRPLNDDRLGRGHRRFRAGGDFLQFLVKGGEIGWTLLLGSRGSANHWRGLRVRLGRNLIGTALAWLSAGSLPRQSLPLFPRLSEPAEVAETLEFLPQFLLFL